MTPDYPSAPKQWITLSLLSLHRSMSWTRPMSFSWMDCVSISMFLLYAAAGMAHGLF